MGEGEEEAATSRTQPLPPVTVGNERTPFVETRLETHLPCPEPPGVGSRHAGLVRRVVGQAGPPAYTHACIHA